MMTAAGANIHWFPGHMMKTLRLIEKELPNVDLIVEILDARIPYSSKNPELAALTAQKPRLLFFNKSDLAAPEATERWLNYYSGQGYGVLAGSAKDRRAATQCIAAAQNLLADKLQAQRDRGMHSAKIRAMFIGIPNVGKSTLINCLAGGVPTKVEDRPGVTRGKQWITVEGMDLLDMPGVLWRKFDSPETALKLAFTGAIKDDILDIEQVACEMLVALQRYASPALRERYKLPQELPELPQDLLTLIARKRGMLLQGGVCDTVRAAAMLLDELRDGKLGRITFEEPGDDEHGAV